MTNELRERLRKACEAVALARPDKWRVEKAVRGNIWNDTWNLREIVNDEATRIGSVRWHGDGEDLSIDSCISLAEEFGYVIFPRIVDADSSWRGALRNRGWGAGALETTRESYPDQLSAYVTALCAVLETKAGEAR